VNEHNVNDPTMRYNVVDDPPISDPKIFNGGAQLPIVAA
jgi:hypothetical protein